MAGIPELTDCKPGLRATGFTLIIAVEETSKQTPGGLYLPDSAVEKEKLVGVRGRIISMSPAAFDHADFAGQAPVVGEVVQFGRLAGVMTVGADGRDYRIIYDKDVIAIVEDVA